MQRQTSARYGTTFPLQITFRRQLVERHSAAGGGAHHEAGGGKHCDVQRCAQQQRLVRGYQPARQRLHTRQPRGLRQHGTVSDAPQSLARQDRSARPSNNAYIRIVHNGKYSTMRASQTSSRPSETSRAQADAMRWVPGDRFYSASQNHERRFAWVATQMHRCHIMIGALGEVPLPKLQMIQWKRGPSKESRLGPYSPSGAS